MSEDVIKKDLTAEIKDLVVEFRTDYGVVQALNGLELEIERGKTLGLVGETGAGKTTTGLSLPPDSQPAGSHRLRLHQFLTERIFSPWATRRCRLSAARPWP